MRRLAAAILILLLMALISPTAVASAEAGEIDTAAVDRFMSDYLARTRLPGASVAITHGDRVVHVAGYGHDSTGAAITGDTRMPVASLSKSVTALAVMPWSNPGASHWTRPFGNTCPNSEWPIRARSESRCDSC